MVVSKYLFPLFLLFWTVLGYDFDPFYGPHYLFTGPNENIQLPVRANYPNFHSLGVYPSFLAFPHNVYRQPFSKIVAQPQYYHQNEISHDEAEHIALDASGELWPNPELLTNITAGVSAIRSQHPMLANVRTNGRWRLGEVDIQNCGPRVVHDLNASEFGPVKGTKRSPLYGYTRVIFKKHFNPDLLARTLREKFGVVARGVWKPKEADSGAIDYNMGDESYTFRQGLANCGRYCNQNKFSIFKVSRSDKASLRHEFATDIPQQN